MTSERDNSFILVVSSLSNLSLSSLDIVSKIGHYNFAQIGLYYFALAFGAILVDRDGFTRYNFSSHCPGSIHAGVSLCVSNFPSKLRVWICAVTVVK